ncbi:ABC transporter ATP-binding protein [Metabacillus sp. GX 13764]|uniref:ABC transporter ATP-binding protein n=1 Tax=Metabacillus kandeliae TaxID=2900151 RepID=UPI001E3E51CC|nr:ABC transporter ATP-binding protein [Metabacillus kandeliae]MCD7035791.1 ABC transporter ATP-binding protein [Metabacillus kandeliae]
MIRFQNVTKEYEDGVKAVDSLTIEIKEGEFFVFIGPSGCGKTTTLKMINRLIDSTRGETYIKEKNIHEYNIHELRWNIGYVLQQIALFPHMTIEENIAIVPELKKWSREKVSKRVDELLEMVGLDPETFKKRKPGELSGGQQQRIGVIRALAADPDIILMDEPFSALDPISREKLQHDIADLQKRIRKTIVFVTHDMQEALALGDRIGIMQDGRLIQADTPENLIKNPANDFVKEFIGSRGPETLPFKEKEIFIKDLTGKLEQADPAFEYTKVMDTETRLDEAIKELAVTDAIAIEQNGNPIGILTSKTIVRYLAEREGA